MSRFSSSNQDFASNGDESMPGIAVTKSSYILSSVKFSIMCFFNFVAFLLNREYSVLTSRKRRLKLASLRIAPLRIRFYHPFPDCMLLNLFQLVVTDANMGFFLSFSFLIWYVIENQYDQTSQEQQLEFHYMPLRIVGGRILRREWWISNLLIFEF